MGKWGWISRNGITDVCFEENGAFLDVYLKSIDCKKCETLNSQKVKAIPDTEYIENTLNTNHFALKRTKDLQIEIEILQVPKYNKASLSGLQVVLLSFESWD